MRKKNKSFLAGVVLMLAITLVGCSQTSNKVGEKENKTEKTTKLLKVNDSDGEVEVPVNPKKVVVFDMGSLDTLKAIGVGDRVVGVPTENLPKYLSEFSTTDSVGGIKEPDLEKINQLAPDVIIISGRQSDFKKELEKIAPTLYLSVDSKDTWNSTKENIEILGKLFKKEKVVDEKLAYLDQEIADMQEKAEKSEKKALVTLVNEGQLSAYGEGSRFGIIHDTFGFLQADENIEASTHGQSVSYEYVLEKNPDILFVVDRTKAIGGDVTNNDVEKNELVEQTTAGKEGKVITLMPDVWYLSGGGIECTELMLKDVEKGL